MNQETVPATIDKIENPFTKPVDERINVGAVSIEGERAIAQVKAAVYLAKQFPRDKFLATEKILEACRRPELAEVGLYAYPRGGKKVEGPSIRAAEIIGNAWGNLDIGVAELSQSQGESEWLAWAWDLETNTRWAISFHVKHERHSQGRVAELTDPRDIYETGANYGSRRKRACILAAVDQDVINAAVAQIKATIAGAVGGKGSKTLQEKLETMARKFAALGVTAKMLTQRLGHSVADTSVEEYTELCSIYKSLEDKMSRVSDWFGGGLAATTEAARSVDEKLAGNGAEAEQSTETAMADPEVCAVCGIKVIRAQRIKSQSEHGRTLCAVHEDQQPESKQ